MLFSQFSRLTFLGCGKRYFSTYEPHIKFIQSIFPSLSIFSISRRSPFSIYVFLKQILCDRVGSLIIVSTSSSNRIIDCLPHLTINTIIFVDGPPLSFIELFIALPLLILGIQFYHTEDQCFKTDHIASCILFPILLPHRNDQPHHPFVNNGVEDINHSIMRFFHIAYTSRLSLFSLVFSIKLTQYYFILSARSRCFYSTYTKTPITSDCFPVDAISIPFAPFSPSKSPRTLLMLVSILSCHDNYSTFPNLYVSACARLLLTHLRLKKLFFKY